MAHGVSLVQCVRLSRLRDSVPLLAALGESTSIPLVQVSLPGDDSPLSSIKLGRALGGMRDQGYAIIGTGQVVHNLRHVRESPSPRPDGLA